MKRVFVNGKFYLAEGRFAQSVLVEDGIISHVNPDVIPDCEIIDLGGRTVLPGFNDSHMHLYSVGTMLKSLNVTTCTSIAQCIEVGREYIAKNDIPPGTLISGGRWNQDYFTDEIRHLNRHDLDAISTVHPIAAYRACGHLAGCNSLALAMAGINRETSEVPGGEIYRDATGNPTGILTENALDLLLPLKHEPDTAEMADTIKAAMDYAVSHGITSVQTNDIRNENARAMLDAYNLTYKRGNGVLRTYHQCCFTDVDGLKDFIAAGHKMGDGDDMHRVGPIKMFVDGSLGARTAAMRQPYHDDPGTTGVLCMTTAQLDEMVQTAHNAGFGCVIHAIGDGAMDIVLAAYEKVINGENIHRHGIIHCQITDLLLLQRFKQSDVLALVQPIFLHYDMKIVESRIGAALAKTSYAFNTMNVLGIRASYGTDAPVEDLGTMNNLYCAINRQDLNRQPSGGYNPGECVPLTRAIDNYTIESAYASFDETKKGRIAPGYFADMCVLDTDIFTIDPQGIMDIKVEMTILGGEIVFGR